MKTHLSISSDKSDTVTRVDSVFTESTKFSPITNNNKKTRFYLTRNIRNKKHFTKKNGNSRRSVMGQRILT